MNQYLIEFNIPSEITSDFTELIPAQRRQINELFHKGSLINYSLSIENGRMWAVFKARNKKEVHQMIDQLPLTNYMMDYEISELTFYQSYVPNAIQFSLN